MADFTITQIRNMISGAVNSSILQMAINTVLLMNEVDVNKQRKAICSSSKVSSRFMYDFL